MTDPEHYAPEGEAWVGEPWTAEAAQKLLDAAREAGFDESVVRTGDDGYYVPVELVKILYPPPKARAKRTKPTEEGTS